MAEKNDNGENPASCFVMSYDDTEVHRRVRLGDVAAFFSCY
jgi:hypothetical protein